MFNNILPRAIGIGFLACCIISLIGCQPFGYKDLQFVFPDGFSGPFVIVEDPNGIPLDARQKLCRIDVPETRMVMVKSADVLREMRRRFAVTTSGKSILVNEPNDSDIALRSGRWTGGNWTQDAGSSIPRFEFFVGTLQEFDDFDFEKWMLERSRPE